MWHLRAPLKAHPSQNHPSNTGRIHSHTCNTVLVSEGEPLGRAFLIVMPINKIYMYLKKCDDDDDDGVAKAPPRWTHTVWEVLAREPFWTHDPPSQGAQGVFQG